MHCIQNSYNTTASLFQAIRECTCALAITGIALGIIGLTASAHGPFNVIVGLGTTPNGILLGGSFFALIMNLVWVATLYKQKKVSSLSQTVTSQEVVPAFASPQTLLNSTDSPISQSEPFISHAVSQEVVPTSLDIDRPIRERCDPTVKILPEVCKLIFSYLSVEDLGNCCRVSRKWNEFASDPILWDALDLRKVSPSLKVFDETDWQAVGVTVQDAPKLNKRAFVRELKKTFLQVKTNGNAGVTLLTIPKDLTLFTACLIVKDKEFLKETTDNDYRHCKRAYQTFDECRATVGDTTVHKTYRIVITNNLLERSENLSYKAQEILAYQNNCLMPTMLEAYILSLANRKYQLHNDFNATRSVDGKYPSFVFGNWSSHGFVCGPHGSVISKTLGVRGVWVVDSHIEN